MTTSDHPFEYHIKANLVNFAFMCPVPFALMTLVPTAGQEWMRHRRADEGRGYLIIILTPGHAY